jgi:polyhydroxyalkanoate synthesis regulator phasin
MSYSNQEEHMNETPMEEKESSRQRGSLYDMTRMVLLAGVGAISLAQDEINNFLDRLVERGEMAETDARKLVREVMDRREKLEHERREHSRSARTTGTERAATRTDIEALNARIADLTRQIEEMRRERGASE